MRAIIAVTAAALIWSSAAHAEPMKPDTEWLTPNRQPYSSSAAGIEQKASKASEEQKNPRQEIRRSGEQGDGFDLCWVLAGSATEAVSAGYAKLNFFSTPAP